MVRRLDRYLRIHHPLLWRPRAHVVLPLSALVAVAAGAIGSTVEVRADAVPTIEQFDNVVDLARLLCGTGLLWWVVTQVRFPMGEQPWRRTVIVIGRIATVPALAGVAVTLFLTEGVGAGNLGAEASFP